MRAELALGFVVACGVIVAGCGGKECGEGTVDMGGRCVPEGEVVTCGEGTTLDEATGMCVADDETVTCGAGTTLDAATGMCEPDVTCATGTVAMAGECVPDGSVICTGNTVFDAATGTCVLDPSACGEGTVLLMGECVTMDDSLIADVHAGGEPDDALFFDGTVTVFTPPGEGETVTIDGCITPANFDGDAEGTIDFDIDIFNFSVSGPGLYDMRIDGLGGLSAGFALLSPDPALAGWQRIGLDLTNDSSQRQVWLPREGQYYIVIFDSRSISLDTLQQNGLAMARAVGSADSCYFMSFEALPTPTPTPLDGATRVGRIGDPQFFTTARTGVVQANLEAEGFTLLPAVVMTDGTEYQNGIGSPIATSWSPVVTDGETLTIVVDNVFDYSLERVDYTLTVLDLPRLPDDGTVTVPYAGSGDFDYSFIYFEGAAGDVLELTWATAGVVADMTIFGPDIVGFTRFETGFPAWIQLRDAGRHIIGIRNRTENFLGATYPVAFTSRLITPAILTVGAAGTVTLDGAFGFARIDASAIEWPMFTLANLMGTAFTNAEVFAFAGDEPGVLHLPPLDGGNLPQLARGTTATSFERIWGDAPGDVLIAVRDTALAHRDETLEVTLADQTFEDVSPTEAAPVIRADVMVPAAGSLLYLARADGASVVTLRATGNAGVDPVVRQLDALAATIQTVNATGADGVETASATVPGTAFGWVAFAVDASAAGGIVDIELTTQPPPYSVTVGTRTFADVCAVGVVVANADDHLTPVRMHTLGAPFQYFGASATRMRIDTNGWITMDANYTGLTQWTGSIPAATVPNAVIAPAWQDAITRVCVFENAAEVVVQWTGTPWEGTGNVEMQAILYADGRIDFVYGANHTVAPLAGRHGLENAAGDFASLPSLAMVGPSRSIRFTPN